MPDTAQDTRVDWETAIRLVKYGDKWHVTNIVRRYQVLQVEEKKEDGPMGDCDADHRSKDDHQPNSPHYGFCAPGKMSRLWPNNMCFGYMTSSRRDVD